MDHILSDPGSVTKIILIYNGSPSYFLEYFIKNIPSDFILSTDRSLFNQATAVLFYLPSLIEDLEADLEKPDGQLWIACCPESEMNYSWMKKPEIAGVFDLWMGDHRFDDIKVTKSFFQVEEKSLLQLIFEEMIQLVNPIVKLCSKVSEKLDEEKQIKQDIDKLGNIYLCSFGDSRHLDSRDRLIIQASSLELFTDIFVYEEHDFDDAFKEKFKSYLQLGIRGYGYWVWKPYIILESLKKIKEGEILLYLDMGCHLNVRGKKRFVDYWKTVKSNESGFLATNLGLDCFAEKKWTKGDVFEYFNVNNNVSITDTPQYQGGILFIRKEPDTIALIERWMNAFCADFSLIDDSLSKSPDYLDFVEHRHDQSILSILLKMYGTSIIPLCEVENNDWEVIECKYPILAKRDFGRRRF